MNGTVTAAGEVAGMTYGEECTFSTAQLRDVVISDPDKTRTSEHVDEGHCLFFEGDSANAVDVETNVPVTFRKNNADMIVLI